MQGRVERLRRVVASPGVPLIGSSVLFARVGAGMYLAATALVIACELSPATGQTRGLMAGIGVLGAVATVALWKGAGRWPLWALHGFVVAGVLLLTVAVVGSRHDEPRVVALCGMYLMALLPTMMFFSPRAGVVHLLTALVAACASMSLATDGLGVEAALIAFVLVAACLLVTVLSRLAAAATVDPLTRLPNRRALDRRLETEADGGPVTTPLSLLVLDLVRFAAVNDLRGREAGDDLLVEVGRALVGAAPAGSLVVRLGSDAFGVLLAGHDEQSAAELAETVHAVLPGGLRATVGVAVHVPGEDPAGLVLRAEAALLRARDTGVRTATAHDDRAVRVELVEAVTAGEMHLDYQEVRHVATGRLDGVEALVRWRRPDGTVVPPLDFVPAAERSGAVLVLGQWVLRTACRDVARWNRRHGRRLSVAVNVSAVELTRPGYEHVVAAALRDAGLAAHDLVLEITESRLTEDDTVLDVLARLRATGVRVAVDDFGTGWSTLARLSTLPIDVLKIDRSFVVAVPAGATSSPTITAIIGLADAMGLEVVAEGVEEPHQLELLRSAGCTHVQGFLLHRPGHLEDLRPADARPAEPRPVAGLAPTQMLTP